VGARELTLGAGGNKNLMGIASLGFDELKVVVDTKKVAVYGFSLAERSAS